MTLQNNKIYYNYLKISILPPPKSKILTTFITLLFHQLIENELRR